ncbi:creatinine amidohydrolase [Nakamurella sp. UYEF19]|uniref:creatininase family protein n=1 Tax=Nakamurella sp. UYEF19 TaxID=1756392 RepID=UPI0033928790
MTNPLHEAARLAWPVVGDLMTAGALPILPFGAQEQHGPHLPLATDTIMADGVSRGIARNIGGLLLPAVPYGQTTDNMAFPGTVALSFDTTRAIAVDVAEAVKHHGAKGFVIVNGDFGNRAPLALAARQISDAGLRTLVVNYPGMLEIAQQLCTTEPAGFGLYHADEFETSIVLALQPDDVEMARAVAEYPEFPPTFPSEPPDLREISASGVFGDPRPATPELGRRLLAALVAEATTLVTAFRESLPA